MPNYPAPGLTPLSERARLAFHIQVTADEVGALAKQLDRIAGQVEGLDPAIIELHAASALLGTVQRSLQSQANQLTRPDPELDDT